MRIYTREANIVKKNSRIIKIAIASGAAVGAIYAVNKIIFSYSTLRKLLLSDDSFFYEWRFGKIHYIKKGHGKPAVLLHDLDSASSVYEWKAMIDRLSKNHTIYAIDLLGCGYSDKPKMTYTNYLFVQMLNDFVREVIRGRTDIIASNSSCSVALSAIHMEEGLYHKLMMINPKDPAKMAKVPRFYHKFYKYMIEIPVFGTLIYNIQEAFYSIKRKFIKKYYYSEELVKKDDIRAYHEAAHTGGSASKYLYASISGRYTNIPVYKAVKNCNHSMIIAGGSEVENIKEIMAKYTELNPSIETICIENAKYMPQLEVSQKLEEMISIYMG